jgi:hypothetical protein
LIENEKGDLIFPLEFKRKYFDQIKQAGYEYSQSICISFCQLDKIGSNCTFRASSINAPNNMDNFCPNNDLNFINNIGTLTLLLNNYFSTKNWIVSALKVVHWNVKLKALMFF